MPLRSVKYSELNALFRFHKSPPQRLLHGVVAGEYGLIWMLAACVRA